MRQKTKEQADQMLSRIEIYPLSSKKKSYQESYIYMLKEEKKKKRKRKHFFFFEVYIFFISLIQFFDLSIQYIVLLL